LTRRTRAAIPTRLARIPPTRPIRSWCSRAAAARPTGEARPPATRKSLPASSTAARPPARWATMTRWIP